MISLKNVTKTYALGKVKAVDGLNLNVQRGEIFGFIGPNGAGKTTTIKMITGILRPDHGEITVGGTDMLREPTEAKRHIGYVSDNHESFDRLTGLEYLSFIADVFGVDARTRKENADKFLTMFGIENAGGDLIKSYSHGMKQKLMLTGALLHNPPLWLLDEPMVGLDPKSALLLKEAMRAHCDAGNTVFFSTHVLEVAERVCDRIGIIYNGRLVASGTLEELRATGRGDATLEQIFFQITEGGAGGEQL